MVVWVLACWLPVCRGCFFGACGSGDLAYWRWLCLFCCCRLVGCALLWRLGWLGWWLDFVCGYCLCLVFAVFGLFGGTVCFEIWFTVWLLVSVVSLFLICRLRGFGVIADLQGWFASFGFVIGWYSVFECLFSFVTCFICDCCGIVICLRSVCCVSLCFV